MRLKFWSLDGKGNIRHELLSNFPRAEKPSLRHLYQQIQSVTGKSIKFQNTCKVKIVKLKILSGQQCFTMIFPRAEKSPEPCINLMITYTYMRNK